MLVHLAKHRVIAVLVSFVLLVPAAGLLAQEARLAGAVTASATPQTDTYYPGRAGDWETRRPEEVGIDAQLLEAAIQFAIENESSAPRDLELNHYMSFGGGGEPYGEAIGPFKTRGDMTGVIVRHGYIVAEWGEPFRVDMTFSVTKSFLSTTVGLAWDRGMIRGIDDRVQRYVPTDHFDSEHNSKITWDHLLRQTSDWEGTLWGKPDWADRPPRDVEPGEWLERERNEPGTVYKYNDVRVNLLALAALHVWRRPLPQVLREYVMDPIGASNTWRWHGYDNSWILIDGLHVQSVSGGGHWGGGMWISARDQARFGLLTLRRGRWKDRQILSDEWVEMALTPGAANPGYGFMNWFLNTDTELPESTFCHVGAGTNMVCAIPEYDLVIVARWISGRAADGFIRRVVESIVTEASGE